MLNYANLNDVEFEYLCQDIMQKNLIQSYIDLPKVKTVALIWQMMFIQETLLFKLSII